MHLETYAILRRLLPKDMVQHVRYLLECQETREKFKPTLESIKKLRRLRPRDFKTFTNEYSYFKIHRRELVKARFRYIEYLNYDRFRPKALCLF